MRALLLRCVLCLSVCVSLHLCVRLVLVATAALLCAGVVELIFNYASPTDASVGHNGQKGTEHRTTIAGPAPGHSPGPGPIRLPHRRLSWLTDKQLRVCVCCWVCLYACVCAWPLKVNAQWGPASVVWIMWLRGFRLKLKYTDGQVWLDNVAIASTFNHTRLEQEYNNKYTHNIIIYVIKKFFR